MIFEIPLIIVDIAFFVLLVHAVLTSVMISRILKMEENNLSNFIYIFEALTKLDPEFIQNLKAKEIPEKNKQK